MIFEKNVCCSFDFPDIPVHWQLFFEFAFTLATTVVYPADIVTDIITLEMYYDRGWYYPFGFSIIFIVAPSILIAILEYNFLKRTNGKKESWKIVLLKTALNIPFQLTLIWYHCQLSLKCFKNWFNYIRGKDINTSAVSASKWYGPTTLERSRGASMSRLNELDSCQQFNGVMEPNKHSSRSLETLNDIGPLDKAGKSFWWSRLTNEQWLSHLNKLKLSESMLESLPQLLINLYLIIRHTDTAIIQYISAVMSYISLCGGVVRYDKSKKDNEADRWMVDRTLLHSRVFYTRLDWPQILFISIYKGCFLAARSLAFVYFVIYFSWYILIPIIIHWACLLVYLIHRWYPDAKVTRQLQQADYKYRAYIFLSHDFMSVFLESLIGIFIYVRPYYHAFIDQPYCFMFFYYVAYVTENITLFLLPGIIMNASDYVEELELYRYYPLLVTEILLNVIGSLLCSIYYLAVHKTRAYTAHAYPMAVQTMCCLCRPDQSNDEFDYWLPVNNDWTVCKQVETSELFFLSKDQLKAFKQTYTTIVRNDRRRGRSIECFLDDRCRIFYAPRSQMKKIAFKSSADPGLCPSDKKLHKELKASKTKNENIGIDANLVPESQISWGHPEHSINEEFVENTGLLGCEVDFNAIRESSSICTSPMEQPDRPVRKPRIKSLRSYRTNLLDEKDIVLANASENQTELNKSISPSTPVPLPRKNITPPSLIITSDDKIASSSHSNLSSSSRSKRFFLRSDSKEKNHILLKNKDLSSFHTHSQHHHKSQSYKNEVADPSFSRPDSRTSAKKGWIQTWV